MKDPQSKRIAHTPRLSKNHPARKWASATLVALLVGLMFGYGDLVLIGPFNTHAQSRSDETSIAPEAAIQIAALIKDKESRTDAEKKIDSRLLYQIKMERGEAIADGVPVLETGLKVDEQGMIDVDISANVSDKLLAVLAEMKAEIIASFPQYHSITARVPIIEIENLAARRDIIFIQPKLEATTNRSTIEPARNPFTNNLSEASAFDYLKTAGVDSQIRAANVRKFLTARLADDRLTGAVNSEGDTTHRAGLARSLAGVTGAGLKIGVLSDGVTSLASRQTAGELPAGVTVLPGQAGASGDEGTAMLELVYDVAPGAQLYFATAFTSITSFAQNIKDLRTAGCDIIIDDVSYFNETPFQNGQAVGVVSPGNAGLVIQAVNDVTVGSQAGALYFSSAANSGNKNDGTAGAWEGDFVDGGATGAPLPVGNNVHNFGGGITQNTLTVAGRPYLKWSDPLGGSANDYDLFALNAAGTAIVASSTNIQSGTQDPIESLASQAVGVKIVIVKKAGAANRFLHLNTNRGGLAVSTSGTIYGHNGGLNTVSVAATPAGPAQNNAAIGPYPNAHSSANVVEQFSSDGPRRIFYNAAGATITPSGDVSSTGGQLLQKPDITAADGTTTTTAGFIPFFGTSAAAPHAGALMALLKQASPGSTRTQLYDAMINSAIDIEAPGVDRDSGTGIFMPLRAMAALGVSGPAALDLGAQTTTEVFGNGNGRIEPGETANLFLPLNNLGLANASLVSATLTTSTTGVTILNPPSGSSLSYPDIAAAIGSATPATPFRFGLDRTFPCGAPISFTLTVTYTGGTAATQVFNFTLATDASVSITSTLDTTAPVAGASYTATTGTQTGRLNRNGLISSCASPKVTPGLQDSTAGRRFDAYTFTASASGCMKVTLSTTLNNASNSMYLAVYNNSGYVPTSITSNYLADWGVTSAGLVTVGFNATAGQQFTIVVHEIAVGGGIGASYTLNVSGGISNACTLAPTAAAVGVAGRVAAVDGRAVRNAIVTLTGPTGIIYSGRSNSFGYYRVDGMPAGQTYIATANAKGLTFEPRAVDLLDNIADMDFTAIP